MVIGSSESCRKRTSARCARFEIACLKWATRSAACSCEGPGLGDACSGGASLFLSGGLTGHLHNGKLAFGLLICAFCIVFALGPLGQLAPFLRHFQHHGLVARIVGVLGNAQTLGGILSVFVGPCHVLSPEKNLTKRARRFLVPYRCQNFDCENGTFGLGDTLAGARRDNDQG